MSWIETVSYEDATGELREIYDRCASPHGTVDNVYVVHSQRPHTLTGHDQLYRSVLHHPGNTLPAWFLEVAGAYTSLLNRCDYAFAHHFTNAERLLGDEARARSVRAALEAGRPENAFEGKELALLGYVRKLTEAPWSVVEDDIVRLREAGATDGEILEVNQVCAYFSYSNRVICGLGVQLGDDVVGYYAPAAADRGPPGGAEGGG